MPRKRSFQAVFACAFLLGGALWAQDVPATLVFGSEAAYPPYSFLNENEEPDGMNIDLVRAICEILGRECRIVVRPWVEIRRALAEGELDAVAGMFYSASRHRTFDFSQPFTRVQHVIVHVSNGTPITSIDQIRGGRIAVMDGDLMHDYVLEHELTDELVLTSTVEEALSVLNRGKVDYALVARLPALYAIETQGFSRLAEAGAVGDPVRYTLATTNERSALLFALSDALASVHLDGTYDAIRDRWLAPYDVGPRVRDVLRIAALIGIPLLIAGAIVFAWAWSLRSQVAARTKDLVESEQRIAHLNKVLMAIRNVNQLITQTRDRDTLLREAVRQLTDTRGYLNAWIMAFGATGREPLFYQSEVGESFSVLVERLASGTFPRCVREVLESSPVVKTASPSSECPDCPLSANYGGRGGLTVRMEHGGVAYGVLCVSVPERLEDDPQEQGLVLEVAGDLAYALHDIDIDEERARLRQRLELANRIVEESPVVVFQWLPEEGWPVKYVSSNVTRFGYSAESLMSGETSYTELVHPDDMARVESEVSANLEAGLSEYHQEYRIIDPQGTEHWVIDSTTVTRGVGNAVVSLDGVIQDVTERKYHEHDLEFQALVLGQISDQIAVSNLQGELTYANRAQAAALAASPDQLIGSHVSILGDAVDVPLGENEILAHTRRWGSWSGTLVRLNPSGPKETLRMRTGLLRSLAGELVGFVFIGTDVSELNRAQRDIERIRARLQALFDSAQDLMYLQDASGSVTHANNALAKFMRTTVSRLVGSKQISLSGDPAAWREEDARVLAGSPVRTETSVTRLGRTRILETIRSPVLDAAGSVIGLCGVCRDVTDGVEARSRLAAMARENEILLRELYHRTKNNMQVVASMVALKRFAVNSGETAALLQDLEARIYAIALVHQKLYQSHDLSRIDLADYLSELIKQIDASYGFGEQGILLETNLESAPAVIDQAVPVGLALNELLSNATKHAFVGRQRGTVTVTLRVSGDEMVMIVADDGVGMGQVAGPNPSHIGLQTLYGLVEMQLGGTIECSVDGGTRWTLRIPKSENDTND